MTRGVSAWSSEGQHRFRHREIKRCRHLDVGGSSVQHLHRPSEPLVEGGVIGDSPPMGLRLGMDIPGWPPENIEEMAKKLEQELLG